MENQLFSLKDIKTGKRKVKKIFKNLNTDTRVRVVVSSLVAATLVGIVWFSSREFDKKLTLFPKAQIQSAKKVYSANEKLEFDLYLGDRNPWTNKIVLNNKLTQVFADELKPGEAQDKEGSMTITTYLYNPQIGMTIPADIKLQKQEDGHYKVVVDTGTYSIAPGPYMLMTQLEDGVFKQTITKDFTWGVLAINSNKGIYKSGETAQITYAVLDQNGLMACEAYVELIITNPDGSKVKLSTTDKSIKVSPVCNLKAYTSGPDFYSEYPLKLPGKYRLELFSQTQDSSFNIEDFLIVDDNVPFSVERTTNTRIYPPEKYPVLLTIKPETDYTGYVVDFAPSSFDLSTDVGQYKEQFSKNIAAKDFVVTSPPEIDNLGFYKVLKWKVDFKAGQTYHLIYAYDAPDTSPNLFLLGPVHLYQEGIKQPVFKEPRVWQIAVDAVHSQGWVFFHNGTAGGTRALRTRQMIFGGTWNAAFSSNAATASPSHGIWVDAAAAPTREEVMIGSLRVNGTLEVQSCTTGCDAAADFTARWNNPGTSWTQDCDGASPYYQTCRRPFDIDYEPLNGRAMVVYGDNSADNLYYALWNGTNWSPNASPGSPDSSNLINIAGGTSVSTPDWVRIIPNGGRLDKDRTNDMMLLVSASAPFNQRGGLYSFHWNGSAFINPNNLETALYGCETGSCFDGAWVDKDTFVVGYHDIGSDMKFRRYTISSGTWTQENTAFSTTAGGLGQFVGADKNPTSGQAIFNLSMSSGTTANWAATALFRGNTSTNAWTLCSGITDCPDITSEVVVGPQTSAVYERWVQEALYTYNNAGAGSSTFYMTTSGNTFGSRLQAGFTGGDDMFRIQSWGSPNNDDVLVMTEDLDCDLNSRLWDGINFRLFVDNIDTDVSNYGATCQNLNDPANDPSGLANGYTFVWAQHSPWGRNWRFYSDITNLTPTTGYGGMGQNSAPTASINSFMRLRYNVAELSNRPNLDTRRILQYTSGCNPNTGSELGCTWNDVQDTDATTAVWRYATAAETCAGCIDGQTAPLQQLFMTSQINGVPIISDKDAATDGDFDHNALAITEFDFPLKAESTTANETYYFRMYEPLISSNGMDSPIYREQDNDGSPDCLPSSGCTYPTVLMDATTAPPPPSISGTIYLSNRTTTATTGNGGDCNGSTANVSLRINGGSAITTTCSNSDGTFTFSDVGAVSAGDTVSIYLTGTNKANSVYVSDGNSDTGKNLFYTYLVLGDDQDGTFSIPDLWDYDNTADATNMLFNAVDAGTDTFTGDTGTTILINENDTFDPNGSLDGDSTFYDLDANSILYIDSNEASTSDEIGITVRNGSTLYINANTTFTYITVYGTGTVNTNSGTPIATLDSLTGIGNITGATNPVTFYALTITDTSSAGVTARINADITVQQNLIIGNGSLTHTADLNTDDKTMTVQGNVTINNLGTISASNTTPFYVYGDFTDSGTGVFTHNNGTITFGGTISSTLNTNSSLYNMIINKTASDTANDNVTLSTNNLTVANTLTITDGEFVQSTLNLTAQGTGNSVDVGYFGRYTNQSTGDITLSGAFNSAGEVYIQSNGSACGQAKDIVIASSAAATRSWTGGSGYWFINDVTVSWQGGTAAIPAYSSTNSGNMGTNWQFLECLPGSNESFQIDGGGGNMNFDGVNFN